jgi:hypothetical protein
MTTPIPIFSIFCIDFRYDSLTADFFKGLGLTNSYFSATAAGAALPVGYKCSCSNICEKRKCKKDNCDPNNEAMALLRNSLVKNLEIALTLKPITQVFLLNHQDCGAIKAFLGCSGYPMTLGANNPKEIEINKDILIYAKKYLLKKFKNFTIRLGLIDINGTTAEYNTLTHKWTKIYTGAGSDPLGLWYNYNFTI